MASSSVVEPVTVDLVVGSIPTSLAILINQQCIPVNMNKLGILLC